MKNKKYFVIFASVFLLVLLVTRVVAFFPLFIAMLKNNDDSLQFREINNDVIYDVDGAGYSQKISEDAFINIFKGHSNLTFDLYYVHDESTTVGDLLTTSIRVYTITYDEINAYWFNDNIIISVGYNYSKSNRITSSTCLACNINTFEVQKFLTLDEALEYYEIDNPDLKIIQLNL